MKKLDHLLFALCISGLMIISLQSFCQTQNPAWVIPGSFVDFRPTIPSTVGLPSSPTGQPKVANGVLDPNNPGALWFYIINNKVYDKNGTALAGTLISTGCEIGIAPVPGYCDRFYIIHSYSGGLSTVALYYSIIDMTQNGGLGQLTTVNSVLLNNQAVSYGAFAISKLTSNNTRFLYFINQTILSVFTISATGISLTFTYTLTLLSGAYDGIQAVLSDDGVRLAWAPFNNGSIPVVTLDPATGAMNSYTEWDINITNYAINGVEFATNTSLFVAASQFGFSGEIYNLDLIGGTFTVTPSTAGFGNSQLGMAYDGFIYGANTSQLCKIDPVANTAVISPVSITNNYTPLSRDHFSLPDQINGDNYLFPLVTALGPTDITICEGQTTVIDGPSGYANYQWFQSITDDYSGSVVGTNEDLNVSSNIQPGLYPSVYYYYLEYEGSNACRGRSNRVKVTINPTPDNTVTVSPGTDVCSGTLVTLTAQSCAGCTYEWHNSHMTVQSGTSNIYTTTTQEQYYVIITNSYGCTSQSSPVFINFVSNCCTVPGATELINHVVPTGITEHYYNNVVINGTMILNSGSTVYFHPGCNVTLNANARIVVAAATLKIEQAYLHGCGIMWDGIYLSNVGLAIPHLNIFNSSTIEDALYSVHSVYDADIDINNSTFNKNLISLQLYTGNYSACNFSYNTFSCTAPLIPTIFPAPPVGGLKSYVHVDLSDNINFTTFENNNFLDGDNGIFHYKSDLIVSPQNTFNNLRYSGISCTKSKLIVNNGNFFSHMTTGIFVKDFSNISVYDKNELNYCKYGINGSNYVESYIDDNTFRQDNFCVYLYSTLQTTQITNNYMYDPLVCAIYSGFNTGASQIISSNHIQPFALPVGANIIQGINLSNNYNTSQTIVVEDNHILNYAFGIYSSMNDFPYIHLNTIVLPPNFAQPTTYRGIYCLGGNGNLLNRNNITGTNNQDFYIAGIHIFNSGAVSELCNSVLQLGFGLLWEGANPRPTVLGNNMTDCTHDLYLRNFPTGLGTQGVPPGLGGFPSDNKWNGAATNQTYANAANSLPGYTNFITRGTPSYYVPSANFSSGGLSLPCTISGYGAFNGLDDICDFLPGIRPDKDDGPEALRLAEEVPSDPDFDALNWLNQKYLYELLSEKPELLQEPLLASAKSALDESPIKDFALLRDTLIDTEDSLQTLSKDTLLQDSIADFKIASSNELLSENAIVNAQRNAEENLKLVNSIYYNTLAIGVKDLTDEQRNSLEFLARLCPYKDGNAVFIAQNILNAIDEEFLDYSHNCDDITLRKRKQESEDNMTMSKIYPNPAFDIVYCDYTVKNNESAELNIKDLNGKIVLQKNLDNKSQQNMVDIQLLSAGAYIVEVLSSGGEVSRHKLNVIK